MLRNKLLALLTVLLLASGVSWAQCKEFALDEGLKQLDTEKYIHDGRFNAIRLRGGDDIRLYKSFFQGESYRITVVAESTLNDVTFEVVDFKENNVLFSSQKSKSMIWDFNSDVSQRLVIVVHVPKDQNPETLRGCIAIMFGVKKDIK